MHTMQLADANKSSNSRRLAGILVAPEIIGELARNGERHYEIESPIRENADFAYAYFSNEHGSFVAVFRCDDFAVVPTGHCIPLLLPPVLKTLQPADEAETVE